MGTLTYTFYNYYVMVKVAGLEPTANGIQIRRSTIELHPDLHWSIYLQYYHDDSGTRDYMPRLTFRPHAALTPPVYSGIGAVSAFRSLNSSNIRTRLITLDGAHRG